MTQAISKDTCVKQLLQLADAGFTGQIFIRYQESDSWILHLSLGWIFYATSSSPEKWQRKFLLHCPQLKENELLEDFLNYSIGASFEAWEYHLLFSLVEAQKITKEQAEQIAFLIIAEALSEISAALSGLEFNKIDESLSDPPIKSFNAASIFEQIRGVEALWQRAGITGSSFDSAPIVKEPAFWHQQLSVSVSQQKITELVDGRHTLWDLAAIRQSSALVVAQVLIPHIISGVIQLVPVHKLPLAVPTHPEIILDEDVKLKTRSPVKQNSASFSLKKSHYPQKILLFLSILLLGLLGIGCYLFWKVGVTKQTSLAADVPSLQSDIQSSTSMHDVSNVPRGLFSYGGSLSFAPLRAQKVLDLITQAQPQYQLRYVEPIFGNPGDHKGVSMLLNNELSFSQNAMPLTISEYNEAKTRGFKLQEVPVGIDADTFFSHPALKIPGGLSVEQLQAIYTGKITNWNQLGGPDLLITPIATDPKDSSAIQMLMSNLPNGVDAVRGVRIVRDYTSAIRLTSDTPGGISFGSIATIRGQQTIKPLVLAKFHSNQYINPYDAQGQINVAAIQNGDYPLTRNVFVDIRRDGTANEKAGVAYANLLLTFEGQRLVEAAGFIPLR